MPQSIPRNNQIVRPVQLPSDCGEHLANEHVVAAGNGQKSFNRVTAFDPKLQHIFLQALPDNVCVQQGFLPGTVICALPTGDKSVGRGDSGSLIRNFMMKSCHTGSSSREK